MAEELRKVTEGRICKKLKKERCEVGENQPRSWNSQVKVRGCEKPKKTEAKLQKLHAPVSRRGQKTEPT